MIPRILYKRRHIVLTNDYKDINIFNPRSDYL